MKGGKTQITANGVPMLTFPDVDIDGGQGIDDRSVVGWIFRNQQKHMFGLRRFAMWGGSIGHGVDVYSVVAQ